MVTIDATNLRERIGRFRILIIGRANAGKTTILQKVYNTTDEPEIHDTKGKKVQMMIYAMHRCCRREILDQGRAHATKLEERIHAIWQTTRVEHSVLVVVVFTNFEAWRPVAHGEIKKQLKGYREKNARRGLSSTSKNNSRTQLS
ncbi:uncharacterized protein HD556DRAFT_1309314 [Suillus plorans]|uniref:G domain-containing protein n=1 Tax=Suillus plorans TaxID=116603 RepID=A0A9P7AMM7_9AGAM|nr:uncharacterized protein HD556DRAFT_1309314 [Suillus plorans]KAG1792495.1 hypothetical protein HD556DRAFT_1309314 [Suillus plorans]